METHDLERYGTVNTWAEEFGISPTTILKRLNGERGITGIDTRGRLIQEGFFAESDIRRRCADLLGDLLKANSEGFLVVEQGEERLEYGNSVGWASRLGLHKKTIERRLKDMRGLTAKNAMGHRIEGGFYLETEVRQACADLLENTRRASETGFFEHEGEKYGTQHAWQQKLGLSSASIKDRLKDVSSIKGIGPGGHELDYYPASKVHAACADLLQDVPRADAEGFFTLEGERYGTKNAWSRVLSLSSPSLVERLAGAQGITGKDKGGRVWENGFFPEAVVRSRCQDLLEELPRADESGFLLIDNERYSTIQCWCSKLGVSSPVLTARLQNKEGLRARNRVGRVCAFYPETVVKQVCSNLLVDVPKAGDDGFLLLNNERYATRSRWAAELGLGQYAVSRRTKDLKGITARDAMNKICTDGFVSESEFRAACADLFTTTEANGA